MLGLNKLEYLKDITILYAEDDTLIQKEFSSFLEKFVV